MLGVIFTGGESPSPSVIRKILKDKEAFYIAADSGLAAAEAAGIKPDLLIGDMDSVDTGRLDAYPAEMLERFNRDKDFTDTELAFSAAVGKGCKEIWIIGGGGGRMDHLFGIRSLFERDIFPCRWIAGASCCSYHDIYCIDACNERNKLLCKTPADLTVSVFPLHAGPWEASSSGLKWPLDGLSWTRGLFGLSNITVKNCFELTVIKGRFMVIINYV